MDPDQLLWIHSDLVLINVYKRLETCQNHPFPEKGFREGLNYSKMLGKMAEGRSQGAGGAIYIYVYIYVYICLIEDHDFDIF